jgi:putative copper export protein/mono/diheme cytochrome c family protein
MADEAILLAVLRGLHLAAILSLLGTIGFIVWVLPAAAADGRDMLPHMIRLWRLSGFVALLTLIAWFALQAAAIAGSTDLTEVAAALPLVARHTRYGGVMLVRSALLLAATLLAGKSRFQLYAALLLSTGAVGLQGLIGHAGAMGGGVGAGILASEALHLLAAGVWLGALAPIWFSVRRLPARSSAAVCDRFSPIGLGCVVIIAGTGWAQGIELIGGLPGLIGTHYGRIALLKIGLFIAALGLAALNRLWLTDQLSKNTGNAQRRLRVSVGCEILAGLAIILAAAFLASSLPATHETPIWPIAWRPSLDMWSDPYGRRQILQILLAGAFAGALLVAGALWRRAFWLSAAVFVLTLVLAGPQLAALLTVAAYPTTFATSPTEFADSSIVHGAKLFAAKCALCHGDEARGDGPAAKSLPVPPADLTAAHFWVHTEGDLFWYISHGRYAPSGAVAMPAFGNTLASDDRWALIDFLKANNAGHAVRTAGRWDLPTPLPQFDAKCADGSIVNLDDLRGRVLHIVAAAGNVSSARPMPAGPDVVTVVLSSGHNAVTPIGKACVTIEPSAWGAFSILLGVAPEALARTQALADQSGWLRLRWRPGDPGDWNDPEVLAAVVRDVVAHPLAVGAGSGHAHHANAAAR